MRPHQWSKNLFVFAGLIFAGQTRSVWALTTTIEAFICFCAISSAVYLINDIADRQRDLHHPSKRSRPIASGALSVSIASISFTLLTTMGIVAAFMLSRNFGLICGGYWLLMMAYTFWLKNEVILDVFTIAAGFVLRAIGGAVVISVPFSVWLIVCTALLALFLGLSKRRSELMALSDYVGHREALGDYNIQFIDQMICVVTAATLISYTFYAFQSDTAAKDNLLILTVPFVLYGIFRYLYLVYSKEQGANPEQLIVEDKPLMFNLLIWAVVSALVVWRR